MRLYYEIKNKDNDKCIPLYLLDKIVAKFFDGQYDKEKYFVPEGECVNWVDVCEGLLWASDLRVHHCAVDMRELSRQLTENGCFYIVKNKSVYLDLFRYFENINLYLFVVFLDQSMFAPRDENAWYMTTEPDRKYTEKEIDDCLDNVISREIFVRNLKIVEFFKKELDEEKLWHEALEENSVDGYERYLYNYPRGIHVEEAQELRLKCKEQEIKMEMPWHEALKENSAYGYERYLNNYPHGIHVEEAQILKWKCKEQENLLERLKDDIWRLEHRMKDAIRIALSSNPNVYPLPFLKELSIAQSDLKGVLRDGKGVVRDEVLNRYSWDKHPYANYNYGNTPESLPTGTVEVYFWGMPSAGHTCIIAAIMNAAKRMGLVCTHSGKDLPELASLFDDDPATPVASLLDRTQVEDIQCLPLNMIEYKEGQQIEHKLSIIENSGEIFECFAAMAENKPLKTAQHEETFKHLLSFLQSKANPKYHFIIVDAKLGLDNRQQRYLEETVLYFKQAGLFNETTQGISIIVTKCDELSSDSCEWPQLATEYIKNCYPAMVNLLKQIVGPKRHGGLGICDGTIKVIPFSIGDVFLQKLCLFNPEPAERMVKMLLECSPTHKGWLDWIMKVFP